MASNTTLSANSVSTEKLCIDGSLQLSYTSITAAAAAEAATATTVVSTSPLVLVTSANAAHRIYLPSPTTVPMGFTIKLQEVSKVGYELSSKGDGTTITTMNSDNATDAAGDFAAELAIARGLLVTAVKTGANAWSVAPGAADLDA
jgi:hypothetical protein